MKRYMIAHDLGTSADKASLVDINGQIVRTHSVGYPVKHRYSGWSEQEPADWWNAFCVCNRVLTAGIDPREVAGISLSGQMMCCLPVGKDGCGLRPAIIWADSRAAEQAQRLETEVGAEEYYRITGMRGSANYVLPKLMWLKEHEPEVYEKASCFLSPKDYINLRLTGRAATDPETAAYMHGLDWRSKTWSQTLLNAAGIDREKLPELLPSGAILGETVVAPEECGLPAGTPVVMGIGDGGAATLGTAVLDFGEAYTILGTSSWVCAVTGSEVLDPQRSISKLNYLASLRDSGTMQAGGFSYSWLRDILWNPVHGEEFSTMNQMAAQSAPGAGGVLFLPYLLGERSPWWDAKLRASFLGMTAQTTRADLCRSVLEGVSLHLGLILDRILTVNRLSELKQMKLAGGGAKSPVWRQIIADVYGIPVYTVAHPDEAGTLGIAVLAGVTLGLYPDISVIREFQKVTGVTEPNRANGALYRELSSIFSESVERLTWVNHRLSDLVSGRQ